MMQHHATARSGLSPSSGTSSTGTVVHRSKASAPKRAPPESAGASGDNNNTIKSDLKTKTVLKEAVDAVVSSFAKHSQGYGRGTRFFIASAVRACADAEGKASLYDAHLETRERERAGEPVVHNQRQPAAHWLHKKK